MSTRLTDAETDAALEGAWPLPVQFAGPEPEQQCHGSFCPEFCRLQQENSQLREHVANLERLALRAKNAAATRR